MTMSKFSSLVLAAAAAATLAVVLPAPAAKAETLYDKLGGAPVAVKVIDDFLANVVADDRINFYFAHADVPKLRENLINLVGGALGGPQVYTGKDMKTAHEGMGIDQAAFNALAEDLVITLENLGVGWHDIRTILTLLAPMERDIVS